MKKPNKFKTKPVKLKQPPSPVLRLRIIDSGAETQAGLPTVEVFLEEGKVGQSMWMQHVGCPVELVEKIAAVFAGFGVEIVRWKRPVA